MNKKVGSAEKAIKEVNEKVGQLESKMADEMGKMSSKVEALQKEMDAKLEAILKAVTATTDASQPLPESEPEPQPELETEPQPEPQPAGAGDLGCVFVNPWLRKTQRWNLEAWLRPSGSAPVSGSERGLSVGGGDDGVARSLVGQAAPLGELVDGAGLEVNAGHHHVLV